MSRDFDAVAAGSPLFQEWLQLLGEDVADAKPPPLGADDALVIIDMQRDFVPGDPLTNPQGGRFGVAEGNHCVPPIVHMIDAAAKAGALVGATRDYHPHDHASFMPQGGPFPPHCVQGTAGARFMPEIAAALARAFSRGGVERVRIAFKAFHEDVDSFGAFPYKDGGDGRIIKAGALEKTYVNENKPYAMGCTKAPWTGAVCFKMSALLAAADSGDEVDVDCPPDLLAAHPDQKERGMLSLQEAVRPKKRMFVCGLALDFCVLDTCLNAVAAGFESVFLVLDAARAAHIPGLGQFGTGFLSDPKEVLAKLQAAGVRVTSTASVTADFHKSKWDVAKASTVTFPESLGPLSVAPASRLKVKMQSGGRSYRVEHAGPLAILSKLGLKNEGKCSPTSACPARWPGAPDGVREICWAYPMDGMAALERRNRLAFLAVTSSVELCFVAFGGYLLLGRDKEVLGVQAIVQGEGHTDQLVFGAPRSWRREFTEKLSSEGRFQPVTLPMLLRAGAKEFCWLNPGEEMVSGAERWAPSENGAFLYMMGGDHPHVYYPMGDPQLQRAADVTCQACEETDASSAPGAGVGAAPSAKALAPSTNAYYRDNKVAMESALSEAVHSAISVKSPQPVHFMGKKLIEIADRSK